MVACGRGRDISDRAADIDGSGRDSVGEGAVAQLAITVPAPALERAVREYCARVVLSERELGERAAQVDGGGREPNTLEWDWTA